MLVDLHRLMGRSLPPVVKYRVMAIDPGTDTVGISILDIDLDTFEIELQDSYTLTASRSLGHYGYTAEVHGERLARILWIEEAIVNALFQWRPHSVACESPFMRRFPQAFAALTQVVYAIRNAVWRYDPSLVVHMVDPPTAKISVGMTIKKGSTKEDVQKAVRCCQLLKIRVGFSLAQLSEHAYDSIAVGMWRCRCFLNI